MSFEVNFAHRGNHILNMRYDVAHVKLIWMKKLNGLEL